MHVIRVRARCRCRGVFTNYYWKGVVMKWSKCRLSVMLLTGLVLALGIFSNQVHLPS